MNKGMAFTAVLLSVTMASSAVAGQPCTPEAENAAAKLSEEGLAAFQAGKFSDALGLYSRVTDLCPTADAVWALARCHEEMTDLARAIELFERVLTMNPNSERKAKAEAKIEALRQLLSKTVRVGIACEPGDAAVVVDDALAGQCPPEVLLRPGKHVIRARKEGFETAKREVKVMPGDSPRIEFKLARVALPALPSPPAPVAPERPIYKKWWFWTAVGGVVAAGAATTTVLIMQSKKVTGQAVGPDANVQFR